MTAIAIFAALLALAAAGQIYGAMTSMRTEWIAAMSGMACSLLAISFIAMLVLKLRTRNAG